MGIKFLSFVLILLLVSSKNGLYTYAFIVSTSEFVCNSFLWINARKYISFRKYNWENSKKYFKPMLVLFIPAIASSLYVYLDKIIINEIIITNNDIIFLDDTLFMLESGLNTKKNAVVIAPHVLSTSYESTNRPWVKKPTMFQSAGLLSTDRNLMAWENIHGLQKVYMVSGCCFAVNANEFERIGAFDENVFLYNEENILSYKIRENGLDVYVNSEAKIIHDHGSTTGNSNIFVDKEMLKSSLYFFRYYENKNKWILALFCCYWTSKMIAKTIMKKYRNSEGLFSAIKEMWSELFKV